MSYITVGPVYRHPAVAGTFYPADPVELRSLIQHDLRDADDRAKQTGHTAGSDQPDQATVDIGGSVKALIAPHAGYIYSGPIAASAYHLLHKVVEQVRRVVLIGPAHYVRFDGIATSTCAGYDTPLGRVPLDQQGVALAMAHRAVRMVDEAHRPEHSLEVHLPFLQEVLDDFTLVPLLAGRVSPQEVASVLESLWGGPETLIVISSDLSHYHDYETANRMDRATSEAIETTNPNAIGTDQACGCVLIQGLLALAAKFGLRARTLDQRNSADTGGGAASRGRVVGYGAYALYQPDAHEKRSEEPTLTAEDRQTLLQLARDSIAYGLEHRKPIPVDPADYPASLGVTRATFVTLEIGGQLRGCIGTLVGSRPLVVDIAHNAYAAAFEDPRFRRVSQDEAPQLDIHLSILSPLQPMRFASQEDLLRQIRPKVDGLLLEEGVHRGTLLPSVWASLPDAGQFLAHLKRKANLPMDYWSPTVRVSRYTVESFP